MVTFAKLHNGEWGVRGPKDVVRPGAHLKVQRKDGNTVPVTVDKVLGTYQGQWALASLVAEDKAPKAPKKAEQTLTPVEAKPAASTDPAGVWEDRAWRGRTDGWNVGQTVKTKDKGMIVVVAAKSAKSRRMSSMDEDMGYGQEGDWMTEQQVVTRPATDDETRALEAKTQAQTEAAADANPDIQRDRWRATHPEAVLVTDDRRVPPMIWRTLASASGGPLVGHTTCRVSEDGRWMEYRRPVYDSPMILQTWTTAPESEWVVYTKPAPDRVAGAALIRRSYTPFESRPWSERPEDQGAILVMADPQGQAEIDAVAWNERLKAAKALWDVIDQTGLVLPEHMPVIRDSSTGKYIRAYGLGTAVEALLNAAEGRPVDLFVVRMLTSDRKVVDNDERTPTDRTVSVYPLWDRKGPASWYLWLLQCRDIARARGAGWHVDPIVAERATTFLTHRRLWEGRSLTDLRELAETVDATRYHADLLRLCMKLEPEKLTKLPKKVQANVARILDLYPAET